MYYYFIPGHFEGQER